MGVESGFGLKTTMGAVTCIFSVKGSARMQVHLWHRMGAIANPQTQMLHKKAGN
jgi:hypothetical protein